jgi:MFS transporter, MHS family, proline/betaine transporter
LTGLASAGIAVAYNTSVPVFCGFAPFIAARLVATTGSPLAPSYDLIATALSSLAVLVDTQNHLGRLS